MIILGIETSCDETSAALVDDNQILSNIITTQTIHTSYGGVVPEFASRAHIRQLLPIIHICLNEADKSIQNIDGIAVTCGPGLAGSLLVGVGVAKGLAWSLKVPFIGINHLEGHVVAVAGNSPLPPLPFLALIASGGHTLLILVKEPFSYITIGGTLDDAAGEAFDKVAKFLGLGYPGGPILEKIAAQGNPDAVTFPRALMGKDNFDFSFSGLKTAVMYYVQSQHRQHNSISIADVCAGFQKAVIDVLLAKTVKAAEFYDCNDLILAGGVARNSALRKAFEKESRLRNIMLHLPNPEMCTDNAAMIARAGHMRLKAGFVSDFSLDVIPNLRL